MSPFLAKLGRSAIEITEQVGGVGVLTLQVLRALFPLPSMDSRELWRNLYRMVAALGQQGQQLWRLLRASGGKDQLFQRSITAVRRTAHQLRYVLETLEPRLAVFNKLKTLQSLIQPSYQRKVTMALTKLGIAVNRARGMATELRDMEHGFKNSQGSIARLLGDPKLVDEIKEIHRMLKERPWRTLGKGRR